MKTNGISNIRLLNRLAVFELLKKNDGISKAEIARQTGLSAPTSMKIVDFINSKDLIILSGEGSNEIGRKSIQYRINRNQLYAISAVIEGNYLDIGIVNLAYEIKNKITVKTDGSFENIMNNILPDSINKLIMDTGIESEKIIGLGIGVPGVYNTDTFELNHAPLVNILKKTNIKSLINELEEKLSLPIYIANDTNMEALGEYMNLGLMDEDLIYISLGTGLGAGIIINGQLHMGNRFMSGEVGYMTFNSDYTASAVTAGWLEDKINLVALKEKFEFNILEDNAEKIDKVIDYVSEYIAVCINNINVCLDCRNVSLGGVIVEVLGEKYIDAVIEKVNNITNAEILIRSTISNESGILGLSTILIENKVKEILESD